MKRSELKQIIRDVIEESKEKSTSKGDWSFFTDNVMSKLEELDLNEGKQYLTELLEKSNLKPINFAKVESLIKTAMTKKKFLLGAYDFKLAAMGLGLIK